MNVNRAAQRAAFASLLALGLGAGTVQGATAAIHTAAVDRAVGPASTATRPTDGMDGWHGDGLALDAADNRKADAFLARARDAERWLSPQVRTAALLSHATLVGFDNRLKSADSLKRKVATAMVRTPGETVDQALAGIGDSVRYTLQWPQTTYTTGVITAARTLSAWGNDSVKWSNTWGRAAGYRAINSGWREPRSGMGFEVQFHTPASKHAQSETHKLYEEQRLPGTSADRRQELQRQQNAIFAAVPVPAGAESLTAPARREPVPAGRMG